MLKTFACCSLALTVLAMTSIASAADKDDGYVLDHKMKTLTGKEVDLNSYKGKVLLIVNVASHCGNTKQYTNLQNLQDKYGKQGLAVIGVPCNQFGKQEPGTAAEILDFCSRTYKVKFDLLEKVDVNGDNAAPLYKELTSAVTRPVGPGKVKWNFEKFVVGKDGVVAARFAPGTSPEADEVVTKIEEELEK